MKKQDFVVLAAAALWSFMIILSFRNNAIREENHKIAQEYKPTPAPSIIPAPLPRATEKPKVNVKAKTKKKKEPCIKNIKPNVVKCKVTAYCPCHTCSEGYGRSTAIGKRARSGHTIAVDPSIFQYGTKIRIGNRVYTAEDRGGGVKGYHIDIFFDNHSQVRAYGVKYKNVEVIK